VYLPNSDIGTPASIVKALYGAGYPGGSAALANTGSAQAVAQGVSDSSDPGFFGVYPGLPKNFNLADENDVKLDNLKTLDAELTANLSEHWSGRMHVQEDIDRSSYTQTGHVAAYIPPPDSMIYSGGLWSVAPSWAAMTAAQQTAASLALANQARNNLGLLTADTQNGTPSPVVLDRAPRVQTQQTQGTTFQAETVGTYNFPTFKIQLLTGIFYDHVTYSTETIQNAHTAASPFFRTWTSIRPARPITSIKTKGPITGVP